jgi:cytidine deaminase
MTTEKDDRDLDDLAALALAARARAYAPYSGFRVGAAVRATSGNVYVGQNVENASYGLSICAERAAIFAMVAAGERALAAVAVATEASEPVGPCGACRQVIREFGPAARLVLVTTAGRRARATLDELLPRSFGPRDLGKPEPGLENR